MRTFRLIAVIAAMTAILGSVAFAQTAQDDKLKDEMGLLRLKAAYPADGEVIENQTPMISVDASALENPLDPASVVITLNGTDVTDSAEVTPAYIVYKPEDPLAPGSYEVRVTSKDVNRKDIEPLSWTFTIKGVAQAETPAEKSDNTSGRLVVSSDYVSAFYVPQPSFEVSDLFREKEGMKFNADLNFSNVSSGRTILGSYHRETQYYTDIEQDKARLNYYDSNFTAVLGDAWFALSDLTVLGAELDGARFDKATGPWSLTLFSGRTQDPSTSGTFKQVTSGLRGGYAWNPRNTSYVTALSAYELDDPVFDLTGTPARDQIASFLHEYNYNDKIKSSFEMATNLHKPRASASDRDSAMRFYIGANEKTYNAEAELYKIGDNFLPIAEGSARYLKNDRDGFRVKAGFQPVELFNFGGEYEDYKTDSTRQETKRSNEFVGVSAGVVKSLTYRHGKLVSDGTVSETNGVNANIVVPPMGVFTETRVTAAWQGIDYTATGIQAQTNIYVFTLNTWYRDVLGFSFSHSLSNTDNLIALTTARNKSMSFGLNWNIIPFKLMWMGRYDIVDNRGSSIDNNEKWLKSTFKIVAGRNYTLDLGYERLKYKDDVSPIYNYRQSIVRAGAERSF